VDFGTPFIGGKELSSITYFELDVFKCMPRPSTFWLAWVILPVQLTYHMSGEFTMKDKVREM
jgi:hypothetical protein